MFFSLQIFYFTIFHILPLQTLGLQTPWQEGDPVLN